MLQIMLEKLIEGNSLTQAESSVLLDRILSEDATDAQIAAVLVALAAKGETAEELAGFAETMRARSQRITPRFDRFIDTCGTGGSRSKTFNVSTAAAFVVAGAGLPVAKHGNVGVTSRSGSADVLRALGVRIDLHHERVREIFDELGICFMFAPLHHAATRRVAMVRRELGIRTIFNLLGPLTNPAGAPIQLIGVSNGGACEKVAGALSFLGTSRAWIVRGEDGLDEITLAGGTTVYEVTRGIRDGRPHRHNLEPEDFGLRRSGLERLRGGSPDENAALIRSILEGRRRDEALDLVLINAAAALYLAGNEDSLPAAVLRARHSIESGAAASRLDEFRKLSNA
ncbi:MAG: anthranilate phosphoribosyltransferase [Acidobacteriota bacterium]|nr:MAG: anthranilate phosphoribosyltransferase [Acidobacteriota bacterium]